MGREVSNRIEVVEEYIAQERKIREGGRKVTRNKNNNYNSKRLCERTGKFGLIYSVVMSFSEFFEGF